MKVKRLHAMAVIVAAAFPLLSFERVQCEPSVSMATETNNAHATKDEVTSKRSVARRDLMLNSLKGMRGLAYGAIHAENAAELESTMVQKLKQLDIPLHPFSALKTGVKPIDGLLEIKVSKVPTANYVQLNLFQWVSLLRQPKTEVRAVTYHDATLSDDADLNKSVEKLTEQFVVDVLKANQQASSTPVVKTPVRKKH